jgi:hypothetical protein
MATAQEAIKWIDTLGAMLRDRLPEARLYDDYYRGNHQLRFASDEFKAYFSKRYARFSDNWTQTVADAPTERLEVIGIRPFEGARAGDDELWSVWLENEADSLSDLAWLDAIVAKRTYALVWGDNPTRITWEHPSQAIVDYDPETRQRRAGLKYWADDEWEFATLYLPTEVWKFRRRKMTERRQRILQGVYQSSFVGAWEPREVPDEPWPLPNPFGVVPLVEMPNRPRLLGEPMSDVAGTIAMQDAINLLWSYLFNAADYASFPQRVVTGAERPKVPILNEDGQVVGERPVDLEKFAVNRVVWLEDPNAKIGEWSAANLEAYTKVIEQAVGHIAAQTRTPAHYLLLGHGVSNVSGDTMKALETGLVKRTQEKTEHFGRGTKEIFRLIALAKGDRKKAAAVARGEVLWRDVESRSEAQLVDSLQKLDAIGFPFMWIAERYGMSPTELERVMRMREFEQRDVQIDALSGVDRADEFAKLMTAVGVGVRAGFEPDAMLEEAGLDPIAHTGLRPVTVQSEEKATGVPQQLALPPSGEQTDPPRR